MRNAAPKFALNAKDSERSETGEGAKMKKSFTLSILLLPAATVLMLIFARTCPAAVITDPELYAKKLIQGGALLEPVNAVGDTIQYAARLTDDLILGITQSRLKIFSKNDIENVICSYWLPHRTPTTFKYYKGHIYVPQGHSGLWIFDVTNP
jgi:hypothetical protein